MRNQSTDDEDPDMVAARKAMLNAFFSKSLCLDRDGADAKYNLRSAWAGYGYSVHKNGGNSFYASEE